MKVAISSESTVDLSQEMLDRFNIKAVPFTIILGDTVKLDGQFPITDIIEYVATTKSLPKTSAVNEQQYEEHFTRLLRDNDFVIHLSLSSDMSSAYFNASNVAKKMNNVFVIDTRSLSSGIALLCMYASRLAANNIDPLEIVTRIKARIPHVQVSLIVEKLDYLHKGGRCCGLTYFAASLLRIRPLIIMRNGKLSPAKKYMGKFDNAGSKYVDDILEKFNNPDFEEVFLAYTTADEKMLNDITYALKQKGFKNVYRTQAGATITSHCGEHSLGIIYINDGGKAAN